MLKSKFYTVVADFHLLRGVKYLQRGGIACCLNLCSNLLGGPLPKALDVERNVRGPFFKTLVKVFTVDCLIDASYYSR